MSYQNPCSRSGLPVRLFAVDATGGRHYLCECGQSWPTYHPELRSYPITVPYHRDPTPVEPPIPLGPLRGVTWLENGFVYAPYLPK